MARRSGRRTDYDWSQFGDVMGSQDLSSTAAQQGAIGLLFAKAETITRVRGKVGVTLDAGGVNESALILCGMTVMGTDAFGAGTVPPELFGASALDEGSWLWQGQLYVSSGAEASVDGAFPGLVATLDVDTKAMRRVKSGMTLAFVFQTPAELVVDQTGTFDLTYWLHVLTGA